MIYKTKEELSVMVASSRHEIIRYNEKRKVLIFNDVEYYNDELDLKELMFELYRFIIIPRLKNFDRHVRLYRHFQEEKQKLKTWFFVNNTATTKEEELLKIELDYESYCILLFLLDTTDKLR